MNSQTFPLNKINRNYLEALEKGNYKMRFGVRYAKMKENDLKLLEEMSINDPAWTAEPSRQAGHAEGSTDKFVALEVRFS